MNGPLRVLRAAGRVVRIVVHIVGGMLTIRFRFPGLSAREREACVQAWARGMLDRMGVVLAVSGNAGLPGPLLLVANHISWLDILVLHASRYCRFVSKADVKRWPLIGTLATGAGTLYIERESRRDAMRVVHRMADSLRAGDVVGVFPEGTTSDGRGVLPFHANLLQAAVSAAAPVQPLALSYVDAATGAPSMLAAYVGDDTLVSSIWRMLRGDGLLARVAFGEAQAADGRDRRGWAASLQQNVQDLRAD